MSDWRPIETCPENTSVLVWCEWDEDERVHVDKFRWIERSEWETVSETAGKSGSRRQIRQEIITREREWSRGGSYRHWMPIPEAPLS